MLLRKLIKETSFFCHDIVRLFLFPVYHLKGQYFRNEIIKESDHLPICILGNGPSFVNIKKTFSNRSHFNLCTVNHSILTNEYFELRPEMHVFADPDIFDVNHPNNIKLYEVLERKINWPLILYVPYGISKSSLLRIRKNKYIKIVRYSNVNIDLQSDLLTKIEYFLYKKGWAIPVAMNVIVACIYCCLNSGYEKVYLYGVEHSWMKYVSVNMNNEVCLEDVHYYGATYRVWSNNSGIPFTMCSLYKNFHILYKSYEKLKIYIDYLSSVSVINKTPDSFIDTFPKE